jgi:flagellar hook-basal body complex protein FliE
MAVNQINPIGPLGGPEALGKPGGAPQAAKGGASFKETLTSLLKDVDSLQKKADVSIQKMASGEINDVHQVMQSAEEAKLAFNMMMEIRNKVMDAYQEVMRIRL